MEATQSSSARDNSRPSGVWPPWRCPEHMLELDHADGMLACPAGEVYPVVAGIPRFVVDQGYAEAFGAQWNHYRLTQLDSHTGATISADRARRCVGEELWHTLDDRLVLECGCGAGRFTEVLLERGARVTS